MLKDILAGIFMAGFITVSILAFAAAKYGGQWAESMMNTIVPMIVQTWITGILIILQYKYGSSASSQTKTDQLAELVRLLAAKKPEEIIDLTETTPLKPPLEK